MQRYQVGRFDPDNQRATVVTVVTQRVSAGIVDVQFSVKSYIINPNYFVTIVPLSWPSSVLK